MTPHDNSTAGAGRHRRRWQTVLAPMLVAALLPVAGAQEADDELPAPAAGYYYNGWTGHLSHGVRARDPRGFASLWWDRRFSSGWGIGTGGGGGTVVRGERDVLLMLRARRHFGPVAALGGFEPRIGLEAGHSFYIGAARAWSLLGSIGLGTPDSERIGLSLDLLAGEARSEEALLFSPDQYERRRARPLLLRLGLTFRH